ncbi:glutamyl-tRNA reductase [Granulicella tundricola]|uniref:Glutamyl-tRNA reductase n=1 Tax=Granulicella tundricola (strain ATCC BAA-1859 / DSM 23138 / MP5ACTX9) TaxID=1198114 RepID=E8X352_GRATM|nr:glutamyl-tRNA reductase [Granulicella tundricola]ADW69276.1 glutamyl-tRNA reductase [Granulicella tundricola MP5ACTX9]
MSESNIQPDQKTPTLVLLGVNHNTAPIDIRERLAIPAGRLADATRSLAHSPGIREGLILSTCNRVELLTVQDGPTPETSPDLLRFLHEYFSVPSATILPHLYEFREREAVRHLFRVASSLDSMVVGEPQILGQVKDAYTIAKEVGSIGGTENGQLDTLLQKAFTVAKKVRSETQIGSSVVSIASVAVDLARKIFGSLANKTILLVGAGKMSELAVSHLIQHGAASILVANRTEARAQKIAQQFATPGVTCTVIPFDDLYTQAHQADIVITSTGATEQLFARQHGQQFIAKRRGRPMFFIDIAVPRDVDPRINEIEGCFVYDIDDLQQVAQSNQANRSREAEAAERIVTNEVESYQQRLVSLVAVPAIKALQQQAEQTRQSELARAAKALGTLTPAQQEAVEALTRSLTNKLLHPQLVALRKPTE